MDDEPLKQYRAKRNFSKTPEPAGDLVAAGQEPVFVIQKHAASRLHYDFRLEHAGVMWSWAVPKGPSYDPTEKRIAVQTEDHPIAYNDFEGTIPKGQYGAGTVIVWDRGRWRPTGDPQQGHQSGKLVFELSGQKMAGLWELVRIGKPDDRQPMWILFKKKDAYARPKAQYDVVTALPDSVIAKPLPPATRGTDGPPVPARTSPATLRALAKAGRPGPLPAKIGPQLATLSAGVPIQHEWSYEIKFDGYRIMARIEGDDIRLITRGGHDWAARMAGLTDEIRRMRLTASWLDGEIVVLGANGLPDFNALQKAFDRKAADDTITYFVFDLPFHEGRDLRELPFRDRRRLLQDLIERRGTPNIRFSADFVADPATILQSACKLGLEGLIAKRADAPYRSARTDHWLKLKCRLRQEFVVAGFTDRGGAADAAEIGSLLLGVHASDGSLTSVGSVGTGWDSATAVELKRRLAKLEVEGTPFAPSATAQRGRWSRRTAGSERWVKPSLVAEVSFADWTPDGQVRHATFVALREDKSARSIRREETKMAAGVAPVRGSAQVKVTHPERVIDESTGLTKLDLVRHYEAVADWMLPHLKGRPVALVRGPSGVTGQLFFQKHDEAQSIPGLRELPPKLWAEHPPLLEVPNAAALASAAQMNVIEFHTWNARATSIERPDRMIFDLDPGEGVPWSHVQEGAQLVHTLLTELGLKAWLKTSGGKGLHVAVPLAPRLDWDTVKDFSQAVVQHLAQVIPSRFVAKSGPANRVGKVFVDYLRNGHGATTAAAFSARARPGLGVSMPVPWEALDRLKSGAHWNIATAREHLSFQQEDPWAGYWTCRQTLTKAMKLLGHRPAAKR